MYACRSAEQLSFKLTSYFSLFTHSQVERSRENKGNRKQGNLDLMMYQQILCTVLMCKEINGFHKDLQYF